MMFYYNDDVFIHSGKYLSYIGSFVRYSQCKNFAIVDVDLSPDPIVRRLRLKIDNISKFSYK